MTQAAPTRPRRLLAISSRASDFVELAELSVELARRGHMVRIMHLYPESALQYNLSTIAAVEELNRSHENIEALAVTDESVSRPRVRVRERAPRAPKPPKPRKRREGPTWEERVLAKVRARLDRDAARLRKNPVYQRMPRWLRRFLGINVAGMIVFLLTPIHISSLRWRLVPSGWKSPPMQLLRARVPQSVKQTLIALPMCAVYRRFLLFFRYEIRVHRIEALLLPEDVVGYTWPVVIKAGHDNNIPSFVFPYTLANRDEPLRSLKDVPAFQTSLNPPIARIFPRWRWKDETMDIVRLPFEHILAHEMLRVSPPDPWTMNSGYANRICVDSPASYEYFKAAGVPETKMEVTGSASQDKMHALRSRKADSLRELRARFGLEGEKPLLLVSGAPEQLAGEVPGCEFPDMESIGAFVGQCLQPLGDHYHLVVRPHPNYMKFGAMLEPWGFTATDVPTSSLVPIADLFVAFASSTIRWAISCAVPTINYDVFHYGYGDYAAASGVRSVQKKEDFRAVASSLVPGSAAYAEAAARIAADSAHWSMMDGHCVDRIEALIERECRRWRAPRTSR